MCLSKVVAQLSNKNENERDKWMLIKGNKQNKNLAEERTTTKITQTYTLHARTYTFLSIVIVFAPCSNLCLPVNKIERKKNLVNSHFCEVI